MDFFRTSKLALYVTYAYEAGGPCGCYPDGTVPATFDEIVAGFNAESFADDCAEIGVDYVNFTAYHANMYPLYPSAYLQEHLPGHSACRDVIRDLIDALHSRGIKLQLYIHATIGDTMKEEDRTRLGYHDPTGGYKRWNDFVNGFFAELVERYGTDIDSYYFDMIFDKPFLTMIDFDRLYKTVKSVNPDVVVVGNGEANDAVDYGSREDGLADFTDADKWAVYPTQTVIRLSDWWWSTRPNTVENATKCTADHLFRLLVVTCGANTEGGGLALGASPYVGGGFEPMVKETMLELAGMIRPIEESIKNTLPSKSYITPSGIKIPELPCGITATTSVDGTSEYIHVLCPPVGNRLDLPLPLDGKTFLSATMLRTGQPAELTVDAEGVHITVPQAWDAYNTVIKLASRPAEAASVAYTALPQTSLKIASSSPTVAGCGPEKAIDGKESTFWWTTGDVMGEITLELDDVYDVCRVRVLPRQDGAGVKLCTHISLYAIYVSEDGEHFTPVASGEWKRSLTEKQAAFPPIRAKYVRILSGPNWLPADWRIFPVSSSSAAGIFVDVKK